MRPVRVGVVLMVLVGSITWVAPDQAGAVVLFTEVPQDTEGTPTDPQECGRLDYRCRVTVGVYLWIAGLIGDLIEFAITLVALPALSTPPPTDGLRMVWGEVLIITNSLYVLMVMVAGVLLMGYQTVQTSTALKEVLPRIVFGFVAANSSWLLIETMRELANAIAISLLDGAATVENVTETIARLFDSPRGEALIILVLMLVGSILSSFFMLAAIIRIVLWVGLTAISPLALACHALPQTEGLAKLWWRAMAALMIIQIAQGLVLRLMVTLFLSRDAMPDFIEAAQNVVDILMVICLMYVLVRIPFWAFRQVFNLQASPLARGAKIITSLLVFRHLSKAFGSKKGGAPPHSTRGRPSFTHHQRPRPDPGSGRGRPPPGPSPGGPGRGPRPGAGNGPGRHPRGGPGRGTGPGRGPQSPGSGPGRSPHGGGPGRGTGPGPGPTPPPRPGPSTPPGSRPRNPRPRRRP